VIDRGSTVGYPSESLASCLLYWYFYMASRINN